MSSDEHPIHWHIAPQNSLCFPGVHFSHAASLAPANWRNYYSFDPADVTCPACLERLAAHVEQVMARPAVRMVRCERCQGRGYVPGPTLDRRDCRDCCDCKGSGAVPKGSP